MDLNVLNYYSMKMLSFAFFYIDKILVLRFLVSTKKEK